MAPGWRPAPPERDVTAMFDRVAPRYDALNTILSLGLDGRWRRATARALGVAERGPVLDLGCGTGELALELKAARVIGIDLSREMLLRARARLRSRVPLVRGSALRLPFRDAAFAGASSAFVLRNVEDLGKVFAELARVVRPGGRVALLDITEPSSPAIRPLFDAYLRAASAVLGALVARREAYRYLARSLPQVPPPGMVLELLERAGFERCSASPLTFGAVTVFWGTRSPAAEP